MTDFAIECTLCDKSFSSETNYSNHKCSAEVNNDLLPIKDEPMDGDYAMTTVDCELTEVKEDIDYEEIESTTVEVDPLAILGTDQEDGGGDMAESIKESDHDAKQKTQMNPLVMSKCLNKYNCKLCSSSFTKKDQFTKHFRKDHSSYRPYECPICKKKFLHKHYVTLHMRVHTGEKPYECPLCPKAYSHKTSYTIHMRIHSGERPYVCNVCGKKCYDKSGLSSHMRSHTKETPYQCEVCGRRFTHSKSLLVHRRNHTGEKPYVCSYCGKAFRHWHKHKIHVRLHTGERPYKCKVCNKGFPRNDEVSRHMKSHSGIKSFKCSICGVYCATQASITGHINLHHENLKDEHDTPPEKTLVQDSKSGILGSKVPEPRSMYKKIHPVSKKQDSQKTSSGEPCSTSASSGDQQTLLAKVSIKSPMRVIEITTKDVDPLTLPLKTKTLQRTLQRSNDMSSNLDNCEPAALNNEAFLEWQQRMLTNQGLVVKGVSDTNTSPNPSMTNRISSAPSVETSVNSKPQYLLISQGSGSNATKILLPLSMTGGSITGPNTATTDAVQPMVLVPQPNLTNNGQPIFIMPGDNNRMFVVSPFKAQDEVTSNQKISETGQIPISEPTDETTDDKNLIQTCIKEEPLDSTPSPTTIKIERPSPPTSPLNDNLNGSSITIKSEPPE